MLESIRLSTEKDTEKLIDIWRRSVLATHHFLAPADFVEIADVVSNEYLPHTVVYIAVDAQDVPLGFMGVTKNHIDTLFIDPDYRGRGIGKTMVEYISALCASDILVDVNEQNHDAVQFYEYLGFQRVGYSEKDPDGRPYPILHLCREYERRKYEQKI